MEPRVREIDMLGTQMGVSDPSLSHTDASRVRAAPASLVGTRRSWEIRWDTAELQGPERSGCRRALRAQPVRAVNSFALCILPNPAE